MPKPGIVGQGRKPPPIPLTLQNGQRLVFHSDGISHRFDLRSVSHLSTQEACDFIMSQQRHAHDDASVLAIDYKGAAEIAR